MIPSVPPQLPFARRRSRRGGPDLRTFALELEVVTPILGGSAVAREVDEIDVIRPATVRGHLRFWWRALYAWRYSDPAELYEHECQRWGRAATDEGGRSAVEIRVDVEHAGGIDDGEIRLYDTKHAKATPGAYALWPARSEKKTHTPPAPRRLPGTRFRLTLLVPPEHEEEIRNVVRAWILFGGYGSRTRRGLGSLTVLNDRDLWLPSRATRDALQQLFGFDIFAPHPSPPTDTPRLAGAALHVGNATRDPMEAWTTALDWLKEFRQGTSGQPGERAREPGTGKPQSQRPSISNWPEADKVRWLTGKTKGHPPRHNAQPAWPRAGFGLPIIGRFQKSSRAGKPYDEPDGFELETTATMGSAGGSVGKPYDEPDGFELRWRSDDGVEHDRLASPLIVKAMPVADGTFVPCVVWLNRAYPKGEVVLRNVRNSAAPFDLLRAPGDTPRFSALAGKQSLREAFLDWLHARYSTTVVAP